MIKKIVLLFMICCFTLFGGYFKVFHIGANERWTTYNNVEQIRFRMAAKRESLEYYEVKFSDGKYLYFSKYIQFETDIKPSY